MKAMIFTFAVLVFGIQSCTVNSVNNVLTSEVSDKLQPRVEIEIPQTINFNQKLEFDWRVSNPNDFPVYVYSSLLKQPAFADIVVDSEKKTIEVYFTRFERLSIAPNFFPKTEFSEIPSNKLFEGQFIGENPLGEKALYRTKNGDAKLQQITSGKWQIRIAVAYNHETESIKETSNEKPNEIENHPINSIVKWQKIAYSDFKTILIENKR